MRNIFMFFAVFTFFITSVASAFEKITEDNFREKVSIWDLDNNHFYVPKTDRIWKMCTQAAKEGNNIDFDNCRLEQFTKKSDLNIKNYEISFKSDLPLKKEWLYEVIHEFLNQEGFSYFTVYSVQSSVGNMDQDRDKSERDYKKCQNNTHPKPYECVHGIYGKLLAYNDPEALRNGVIYDAGQQEGGLFMFHDIYTNRGVEKSEIKSYLMTTEYTNQAWEVTHKVDSSKKNQFKYDIKRYSESILAEDDKRPINFSNEFSNCKNRLMDANDGRFSEQNECYCNCVQQQIDKSVKKLDNPNKVVIDIIESSYGHCDWRNSTMVNYHNKEVADLLNKEQLSKYDECRLEIYMKYTTPPVKKGAVNICNVEDIILHMPNCSTVAFGK